MDIQTYDFDYYQNLELYRNTFLQRPIEDLSTILKKEYEKPMELVTSENLSYAQEDDFQMGKVLSYGYNSKLCLSKCKKIGILVVLKIFFRKALDDTNIEFLEQEIIALHSLSHPNIIGFYDYFRDEGKIFIVMEYAKGGSLDTISNKILSENVAATIINDLTRALQYCSKNKIIHRDVKPDNIVVDEHLNYKLIDFGLCGVQGKSSMNEICGSHMFVAPEILSGEIYDHRVDIWSMGVSLYVMLTCIAPFDGKSKDSTLDKIEKGVFKFPDSPKLSNHAKDLITKMLTLDKDKRITFEQILSHPFLLHTIKRKTV